MTDVLPDLAPRPVAVPSGGIEDSLRSPASFFAWLAFLTVATIAMFPLPVPSWSEHFYLITPLHVLDRGFLARDWTVANEYRTHLGFTYLAAGLIKLFGLQGAGWIGRVLTAVLVQSGLLRLGARLGVSYGLTTAVILLWLACGQSLFGGDWMLRTFEGKTVAYGLLLWSMDRLCGMRWAWAGVLAGLAFTLNPDVGLISGTGLLAAALMLKGNRQQWIALVACGLAFSLPGLAGASGAALGGPTTASDWNLFCIAYRSNVDPTSFGASRLLLGATMTAFCVLHLLGPSLQRESRAWVAFVLGLGIPTVAGLGAWAAHSCEWLRFLPFRAFPLILPLVFLLLVARKDFLGWGGALGRGATVLVLFSLMALPDPAATLMRQLRDDAKEWTRDGDYDRALMWIRDSVPASALLAVPPNHFDTHTLSRHAVVALFSAPRYDMIHEWRERIESMTGPINDHDDVPELQARFENLPLSSVQRLGRDYGVNYIVTAGTYQELQAVHRNGKVTVYQLSTPP